MHENLVHVTGVGSSEVDLIIAAAAGILGAILGASVTGLLSFRLESRRELTRARAGARLMRSDFEKAAAMFSLSEQLRRWPLYVNVELSGWEDFRDVLAAHLDANQWDAVDIAVRAMRNLQSSQEATRERRAHDPESGPPVFNLNEQEVRLMATRRTLARTAYNVLAELAGGSEADENFGAPPQPQEQ